MVRRPAATAFLEVNEQMTLASDSPKFCRMIERVAAAAKHAENVLIVGDPGSGKELVAEAMHFNSGRKGKFVKMNCAAIPGDLLESELFGHKKGAYTGATSDRPGKFLEANGGTIFLDEICSMDVRVQPKLLRVVEYGEFYRVGDEDVRRVEVRIVAAVNDDLSAAVMQRRLRKDLLYRLSSYTVHVPSLNERSEDLPRLIDFFLVKFSGDSERLELDDTVLRKLLAHSWPGNVRELRSVIASAVINTRHRGRHTITEQDLDPFPSDLLGEQRDNFNPLSELVDSIYAEKFDFKTMEKELRRIILREIAQREDGDTGSISRLLKKTPDNVRTLFSRSGVKLGKAAGELQD